MQRVGPRQTGARAWPGVAHSPRTGPAPDTQASLVDKLTALANALELFCSLQIQYERQTLDLHVQEEEVYVTKGSETDITLTFQPQTSQQEYIDTFSLGCTGADATIASLIATGVTGYVQLGGFVVNFNVPSVTDTELDVLLTQSSTRVIHLFTNTGDFPAGLTFRGMLTGRVVPSSIPNVEHGGVLH